MMLKEEKQRKGREGKEKERKGREGKGKKGKIFGGENYFNQEHYF